MQRPQRACRVRCAGKVEARFRVRIGALDIGFCIAGLGRGCRLGPAEGSAPLSGGSVGLVGFFWWLLLWCWVVALGCGGTVVFSVVAAACGLICWEIEGLWSGLWRGALLAACL